MLVHESDGQSGGFLMMWTSDISIREQGISKNFIDVVIDNGEPNWRFIGLYGEPEWSQKSVTWDALHSIRGDGSIPWLVMGDFNEILFGVHFYSVLTSPPISWLGYSVLDSSPTNWLDCLSLYRQLRWGLVS